MDVDQLQQCVRRYKFLSPRLNSQGFSHEPQKTHCHLSQRPVCQARCDDRHSQTFFQRLWKWLPSGRASCEGSPPAPAPTATDRMENARAAMQQKGQGMGLVSEMEIQDYLSKETGMDRLRRMFEKNEMGKYSQELQFIYQVTLNSAGMTFLCMFILAGRQAKNEFIERNRATVFKTRFQAARRLQDTVFLYGMKEGFKWAIRVSLFSTAFLLISQSIAVYRNKSSIWEYSLASAAVIGAMKSTMGLRGFLVGTGFGAVAGSVCGLLAMGVMKMADETQEQRHYWQIQKQLEADKLASGKLPEEVITAARRKEAM